MNLKNNTPSNNNNKNCDTCKYHSRGKLHGYDWQECQKNWTDKQNGERRDFIGVLKHLCNNWKEK